RQQPERGVRLVAGRPDRVEARALLLEVPRREVEVPALGLRLEQRLEPLAGRTRDRLGRAAQPLDPRRAVPSDPPPDIPAGRGAQLVGAAQLLDRAHEVLVDPLHDIRGWHGSYTVTSSTTDENAASASAASSNWCWCIRRTTNQPTAAPTSITGTRARSRSR